MVKSQAETNSTKISKEIIQCDNIFPKYYDSGKWSIQKLDWKERGRNINGDRLGHLRFVDGVVLTTDSF